VQRNSQMRPSGIYDGFIRLEERSAEIYLELSVHFLHDVNLSWFWVEMAMEEKQHAGLLQYCLETGICAAQLPGREQILRLKDLFEDLETRLADPALTLDGAFEIAMFLEGSEINEIYKTLTAPIEGPWYVLRKKIDLSVGNHFEKLEEAARRFGASPDIQKRLAMLSSRASDEVRRS
jgi:hypothetical protein